MFFNNVLHGQYTCMGIKTARRNINNLRYAEDTTLMAESEEALKSLLMKVQEETEKASLKLIKKKKRLWHLVPSLYGKQMGKKQKLSNFIFLSSKITTDCDCTHKIKRHFAPWKNISLYAYELKGWMFVETSCHTLYICKVSPQYELYYEV